MTEIPATDLPAALPVRESAVAAAGPGGFAWWTVGLLGVVTTLFGIAVLVWPDVSLKVMAVLVGLWVLLAGVVRIFGAFVPGAGVGRQVLSGIVGVLLVLGGMACLRDLANALALLWLIVAFSWLFGGLSETVMAFETTGPARIGLLVLGVVSIGLGLVFLFVPRLSLGALVLIAGISAIVTGLGELVVAFQLRRARV